jgi:hypothetical protein
MDGRVKPGHDIGKEKAPDFSGAFFPCFREDQILVR